MKKELIRTGLLAMMLFLTLSSTAMASNKWFVNGIKGSDSNDCRSRRHACLTIGHAIALASAGDSVLVAAATYPENVTIGFNLSITGAGASTTIIDGGAVNTVVTIPNANTNVAISKLTIQNGLASMTQGGGISNSGTLTIRDSFIINNVGNWDGGGISNGGTLTISNTTVGGNFIADEQGSAGGGIYNAGSLSVTTSTFSTNGADWGGGIANMGAASITRSTFSQNTGIHGGGGIWIGGGSVTVSDSTFFGNAQLMGLIGGGAINGAGSFNNVTISGNTAFDDCGCGGGITGGGVIQNSIVANNSPNNCGSSPPASLGYNLSSDSSCNFDSAGDLNNVNPGLGPLQDNGGPTQTMALPPGSPAVDAGNPKGCTNGFGKRLRTDQRGEPRPDPGDGGKGCDMGAYELQD